MLKNNSFKDNYSEIVFFEISFLNCSYQRDIQSLLSWRIGCKLKMKVYYNSCKKIIYKNRILLTWIGNASTSSFSVICLDWRDEGIYAERSDTRDPTLNEPLVYEYVAYIPETDGSTKYYQSAVPIFRGSEYLIMLTY